MTPRDAPAPGVAWLCAFTALAFLIASYLSVLAGDAGLYLAHGHWILDHGALPTTDPFTVSSAREPLVLHLLLPMIGFAWIERALGAPALIPITAAVGAIVLAAFAWPTRRTALGALAAAALLALLVVVDHELFEVRAQIWAYLPFVVILFALRHLHSLRTVHFAAVALTAALWANSHPSFLIGIALPLVFAAALATEGASARRLIPRAVALAFIVAIAALASPYGPALLIDVVKLVFTDSSTHRISHMRSPPLSGEGALGWAAFLAVSLGLLATRAVSAPRRWRRRDLVVGTTLVVLTLVSRRYAAFSAAWSCVLIAALAPEWRSTWALQQSRVLHVVVPVLVGASLWLVPAPRDLDRNLPFEAATVLEQREPRGRLLNEFGWGGYLMWRWGAPASAFDRQVFIDGRNNLYRNGVFNDYLHMTFAAPDLDALLELYAIDTVLWTRSWDLDLALRARPQTWRELYRDDKAVIYVRRE